MKKQILFSLFILIGALSHGQIIKGRVLDQSTQKAIIAANIYFNGTAIGTMSDTAGYFELNISKHKGIPLTISSIGYNSVTLANPEKDNLLTILLTPKSYNLSEIKVAGKIRKSNNMEPLYIVDGEIVSKKEFYAIKADRIEKYGFITGESATALYGAEACKNGIRIIKTKE